MAEGKDVPDLVAIAIEFYRGNYREEVDRERLTQLFTKQVNNTKGWMWVAEQEGKVVGFSLGMPTSISAEQFINDSVQTNEGTYEGVMDNKGKYLYGASFYISKAAKNPSIAFLFEKQIFHDFIKSNKDTLYIESRIPSLKNWVYHKKGISEEKWRGMSPVNRLEIVTDYVKSSIHTKGKSDYDNLIYYYSNVWGSKFVKVIQDALDDPDSLNYGTVLSKDNPYPPFLRITPIRQIIAKLVYCFR